MPKAKAPADRLIPAALVRLTLAERELLSAAAKERGLSLSAYLRSVAIGMQMPPQRIPKIDRDTYSELGRVGNNLNQVAKSLNAAQGIYPNEREISQAVKDCISWIKSIRLELWRQ